MKDIFANLYNKVVSFFHQSEECSDKSSAKDVACNRLKLVLMQDRTNLSPAIMDRMRHELIELLSRYVELDRELLDLNFEQEDNQMALMLSIPVIRAKEESEIEEILKVADEEAKAKEAEESEEETTEETEESSKETEPETTEIAEEVKDEEIADAVEVPYIEIVEEVKEEKTSETKKKKK